MSTTVHIQKSSGGYLTCVESGLKNIAGFRSIIHNSMVYFYFFLGTVTIGNIDDSVKYRVRQPTLAQTRNCYIENGHFRSSPRCFYYVMKSLIIDEIVSP